MIRAQSSSPWSQRVGTSGLAQQGLQERPHPSLQRLPAGPSGPKELGAALPQPLLTAEAWADLWKPTCSRSHGRHSRKSVLETTQQMCNKLIWLHVTSPVPASSPVGYMEIPPVKPTFLGTSPVVGWPLAFRVPQVPQLWQGSQAPRQSHLTCVRAQS